MKRKIKCPHCKGKDVIKKGKRETKFQEIQRYKCKDCEKSFTKRAMRNRSYSARVIYSALNYYDKGLTLRETSKEINKRYGVKTYPKLISSWLQSFEECCPYLRIRKDTGALEEEAVLYEKKFFHPLPYLFKFHKVKADKFVTSYFSPLIKYFKKVPNVCPDDIFLGENLRCSQVKLSEKFKKFMGVERKENYACTLADFALRAIRSNRERHDFVENFMLLNDTATLGIEIPVWLLPEEIPPELDFIELEKPLTGHIDLVQARYGILHILDFKPQAKKTDAISQLFLYALALSLRTDIWLRNFRCAWFDENDYYEFNPNAAVVPEIFDKGEEILDKYIQDEEARKYYTGSEFHSKRRKKKEKSK